MIPVICCQPAAQAVSDVPHVLLIEIVVFALRMLKMSRSGVIRVVPNVNRFMNRKSIFVWYGRK